MSDNWGRETYDETIAGLRRHLRSQCKLSRNFREYLDGRETSVLGKPAHTLTPVQIRTYQKLLRSLEVSISSLLRLTSKTDEHVRDCFSISRSIVETSINAAFIAAGGKSAAEEARKHSLRRSYQDLEHRLDIGSIALGHRSKALDDPDRLEDMRRTLEKMNVDLTTQRREWTHLSAPKRLEVVLEKLGDHVANLLAYSYFMIYREASEVLHGSIYGCFLSHGGTMVDQDLALHDTTVKVLFASGISFNRAISAIGKAHNLPDVYQAAEHYDLLLTRVSVFGNELARRESREQS
jgi:uncharacterized protein DUF5677